MHVIVGFAQAVGTKLTVWLVAHGVPYVAAGTLALAGIGAAIANPPPAGAPQPSVGSGVSYSFAQSGHHCDHDNDSGSGKYYAGY